MLTDVKYSPTILQFLNEDFHLSHDSQIISTVALTLVPDVILLRIGLEL